MGPLRGGGRILRHDHSVQPVYDLIDRGSLILYRAYCTSKYQFSLQLEVNFKSSTFLGLFPNLMTEIVQPPLLEVYLIRLEADVVERHNHAQAEKDLVIPAPCGSGNANKNWKKQKCRRPFLWTPTF